MLSAIRRLQAAVRTLRASTQIKKGYLGFDLAENTLGRLYDAVSKTRSRDQIASWIKETNEQMALTGGGDVAPAVKQAHVEFNSMLSVLAELPAPREAS